MHKLFFLVILFFMLSCEEIDDDIIFNNDYQIQSNTTNQVSANEFLIDNFARKNRNSLKGAVNAWNGNPGDRHQYCKIKYNKEIKYGDSTTSMQISYSVDSPEKSFNGIYSELKGIDISSFNSLVFYVKGDAQKGFTSVFKIELKNNKQVGSYLVKGITDDWQKIVIPLRDINGINDFSSMKEFTIVFDDMEVTQKQGILYIDDLYVTK